jgi:thiol-disulfide isomerase/thioredoxin
MVARILLACASVTISTLVEGQTMSQQTTPFSAPSRVEGELPSFSAATTWLNSEALTPSSLKGKVVVVEFWTYTCINWLRTMPYVRAWAEKYRNQGLVVIGVHSPEYEFEKNLDNVRRMTKELDVDFPVAVDSEHGIWSAFNNGYWPALYFVDPKGQIRHHQFGEGEYAESERVIQQLLAEAGNSAIGRDLVSPVGNGVEAAADWSSLGTPETYLGYDRTQNFASPGGIEDGRHVYALPNLLSLNHWALAGSWTVGKQGTVSHQANARLVYRFHARDVHLVMGPASKGASVRFRVLIDGAPIGAAHGVDVDEQGFGKVTEQRLYQLIRQSGKVGDREFKIEFLDPGVEVFAFTFG